MPEGDLYIEKRRYKRVDRKMRVTYKLAPSSEEEEGKIDTAKKLVETADISIDGLQLICEEDIPISSLLRLDVEIEGENKPLATFAEVRWARFDTQIKKFRIGLQFLVIKEDHVEAIKKITGGR